MLNFVDDGIALIRNVNKYVFLEAEKELVIALEDKFYVFKAMYNGALYDKSGNCFHYIGRINGETLLKRAKNTISSSSALKDIFEQDIDDEEKLNKISILVNNDINEAYKILITNEKELASIFLNVYEEMSYKGKEIGLDEYHKITEKIAKINEIYQEKHILNDILYEIDLDKCKRYFAFRTDYNGKILFDIYLNKNAKLLWKARKYAKDMYSKSLIEDIYLSNISFNLTDDEPYIDVGEIPNYFKIDGYSTSSHYYSHGLLILNRINEVLYRILIPILDDILVALTNIKNIEEIKNHINEENIDTISIKISKNQNEYQVEKPEVELDDFDSLNLSLLNDFRYKEKFNLSNDLILIVLDATNILDSDDDRILRDEINLKMISISDEKEQKCKEILLEGRINNSFYAEFFKIFDKFIIDNGVPRAFIVQDLVTYGILKDFMRTFGYPDEVVHFHF